MTEKSAVERLAENESKHLVRWVDNSHLVDVSDLCIAIEADRAAGWLSEPATEFGAYGRAKQTISEMRTRFAKESQEHARKARALARAETEVERLRAGSRCPECSAVEWNEAARLRAALATAKADALDEVLALSEEVITIHGLRHDVIRTSAVRALVEEES